MRTRHPNIRFIEDDLQEEGSLVWWKVPLLMVALVVLPPVIILMLVSGFIHRVFGVRAVPPHVPFDDLFSIVYVRVDRMRELLVQARLFTDMPALFWSQGLHVFALLGEVFALISGSLARAPRVFPSELVFVIPVLAPVVLFRTRGPACPHIPRPPPSPRLV